MLCASRLPCGADMNHSLPGAFFVVSYMVVPFVAIHRRRWNVGFWRCASSASAVLLYGRVGVARAAGLRLVLGGQSPPALPFEPLLLRCLSNLCVFGLVLQGDFAQARSMLAPCWGICVEGTSVLVFTTPIGCSASGVGRLFISLRLWSKHAGQCGQCGPGHDYTETLKEITLSANEEVGGGV